ncbi:MAG: hypothetical protein HGB17_17840, partial [Syntrophobacteraceae bacterium]|nr:hypothetical protein [Syntrophobacteraceae bacterium]
MRKLISLFVLALLLTSCAPTPAPTGTCEITPTTSVIAYTRASAASDEFGILSETVQATVRTADGFFGFDPGVAQAGNVGLFRMRWVLKTSNLTTSAGCADLPVVVPPIAGICYAMIMSDVPVYSSPDATSSVLLTMHSGDYAMMAGGDSGWYTLDLNVGTPAIDNLGYIEDGNLG